MNNIFVTIGLPCSGKTKYCYDNAKNTTQVIQNVNDINIFYQQDDNGDAIKNFLQNDIYIDMDNYSGNEIEYKLIKLFRLSIFDNHKFNLHIVRFKENKEQSLYNLQFSPIPEHKKYEIEKIIIRKKIPTIHIGKLLRFDCIETVDVIEMDTFACPYYYRELNNSLKLHIFGNKFVTTKLDLPDTKTKEITWFEVSGTSPYLGYKKKYRTLEDAQNDSNAKKCSIYKCQMDNIDFKVKKVKIM